MRRVVNMFVDIALFGVRVGVMVVGEETGTCAAIVGKRGGVSNIARIILGIDLEDGQQRKHRYETAQGETHNFGDIAMASRALYALVLVAVPLILTGMAEYNFPTSSGIKVTLTRSKGRHACSPTLFLVLLVGGVGGKSEADSKACGSKRSESQPRNFKKMNAEWTVFELGVLRRRLGLG